MLWDGQRILDEPGDQVAVTVPFVGTSAEKDQGGAFTQECRCLPDGVLVPFRKLYTPRRVPVVDVAQPAVPHVAATVAGRERGTVPLWIPTRPGLGADIEEAGSRVAHQAVELASRI